MPNTHPRQYPFSHTDIRNTEHKRNLTPPPQIFEITELYQNISEKKKKTGHHSVLMSQTIFLCEYLFVHVRLCQWISFDVSGV